MAKVEVQKGPIKADQMTMKRMTHAEKVAERKEQLKDFRSGGDLKMHTPKGGKK